MIKLNKSKEEIRKKYLKIRKDIPNKSIKSHKIMKKVTKTNEYKNANVIALYKNLNSEVATDYIINHALNNGKTVVLPKVVNKELYFYKLTSSTEELKLSNLGIKEPIGINEKLIANKDIELIIVPGVCFDKKKNRLGFGGGYYDRFLEDKSIFTIGVCFNDQIYNDELPITNTDIKMDKIITDNYIIDV